MRNGHATPSALLAETALRELLDLSRKKGTALAQITEAAELSLLEIDIDRRQRRPRGGGRPWLAKVTSFAFPRAFATQVFAAASASDPAQMTEEELLRRRDRHTITSASPSKSRTGPRRRPAARSKCSCWMPKPKSWPTRS
ncbi:hypothetical protein [Streptomyces sp. NPDC088775]|uniref:hypothetical protein n=1 Tax=Streptomyces sp. NPDC088775 TaxID=3365896 RepID=UPI0038254306